MTMLGTVLIVIGTLAVFSGGDINPYDTDPFYAFGRAMGPFLFLVPGIYLVWKGRKSTQ